MKVEMFLSQPMGFKSLKFLVLINIGSDVGYWSNSLPKSTMTSSKLLRLPHQFYILIFSKGKPSITFSNFIFKYLGLM